MAPDSDPLRFMAAEGSSQGIYRYVSQWLPQRGSLLDLGCGAGGFLRFAADRGLKVTGIDRDKQNVADCLSRGLHAVQSDVHDFLAAHEGQFDAISMVHLIEHFHPADANRLVRSAAAALAPKGRLIVVTPNFADPSVSGNLFWLDPTHVRPYPLGLIQDMCESSGLAMMHMGTGVMVKLGRRRALSRPLQRLRFGREFERMNAVAIAGGP